MPVCGCINLSELFFPNLMFRFHGSRKPFTSSKWWGSVGPHCSDIAGFPGCCHHGDVTHPSESNAGPYCVFYHLPAPLDRCFSIWELLLLLHAQGGFFSTCPLLLQVSMWSPVLLHQENTDWTEVSVCLILNILLLLSLFIHLFVCRTDCESPSSFLCSYPVANISLMRNKKHVCMQRWTLILK